MEDAKLKAITALTLLTATVVFFLGTPSRADQATTAPAPVASPKPATDNGTANLVPLPGLVLTQDVIDAAVKRGRDYALKGKTGMDLVNDYSQNPFWVRGHSGRAHESWVYAYGFDGQIIAKAAFDCERLYKPFVMPPESDPGTVVQNLPFRVFLESIPKVKTSFWGTLLPGVPINTISAADRENTEVDGFVLSDDKGNNIQASNAQQTSSEAGTATVVTTAPDFTSGTVYTAHGASSWTSTSYAYVEKNRPYYTSRYDISFDLYDEAGHLLLDPNTRKLILRIVTPTGEMDVEYPVPYKN